MLGKKLLTLVLAASILLIFVAPTLAQDEDVTPEPVATERAPLTASSELFVTTEYSRVNVRSGPSITFTIIGTLTPVDSLDVTGKNEDADWLRVNFNGQEGWIFASVLDINGDIEPLPVVEPSAPVAQTQVPVVDEEIVLDSDDVMVTTLYNTNLRSTFSTDADVLEVIPFNTELLPTGRTDDNNWLMVSVEEQNGWIYAPILFFASGEVEALPILATVPVEPVAVEVQ